MKNYFGTILKELRKEKELSQKSLALVLGVSDAIVCKWEKGISEPTASNIFAIAKHFNVNTDYLLGLEDDYGNKINSKTYIQKMKSTNLSKDEEQLIYA